jgi:hypothetical protein
MERIILRGIMKKCVRVWTRFIRISTVTRGGLIYAR